MAETGQRGHGVRKHHRRRLRRHVARRRPTWPSSRWALGGVLDGDQRHRTPAAQRHRPGRLRPCGVSWHGPGGHRLRKGRGAEGRSAGGDRAPEGRGDGGHRTPRRRRPCAPDGPGGGFRRLGRAWRHGVPDRRTVHRPAGAGPGGGAPDRQCGPGRGGGGRAGPARGCDRRRAEGAYAGLRGCSGFRPGPTARPRAPPTPNCGWTGDTIPMPDAPWPPSWPSVRRGRRVRWP